MTVQVVETHPWPEVDNSVQFDDDAGFAGAEAVVFVLVSRAFSQQLPGETASLPDPDIALQVAPVLISIGCF